MAQRGFTYPIRFAQAALTLVLCVILATGAIADSGSRGRNEDARGNSHARPEVSTKSSTDRSTDRSPAKSTGSTSTIIRRNPAASPAATSSTPGTASRTTTPRIVPERTTPSITSSYSRTGSKGETTSRPASTDYGRTTYKPASTDYGRSTYKPVGSDDGRTTYKPVSSGYGTTDRTGGSDRGESAYKPSGDDRRHSTYTPGAGTSRTEERATYTPPQADRAKENTGTSWRFGSKNRPEDARVERVGENRADDSRASSGRFHSPDDRSDFYPEKPQVGRTGGSDNRNIYVPSDRVPTSGGPKAVGPGSGPGSSDGQNSFRPHSPDGRSDHYPDKPEVRRLDLDRSDFKPADRPEGLHERDDVRPLWKPDGDRDHHDYRKPGDSKINIDIDINFFKSKGYHPPEYHKTGFFYHTSNHYCHKPLHYGFWVFDRYDPIYCRRSVYFHYGYFPHVFIARLYIRPYFTISYCTTRVVYDHSYYLARDYNSALDRALSDIRRSWLDGRLDLVRNHVYSDRLIDVLIDGEYDYSIYGDEYIEMTWDALDNIQTISFTWEKVRQRTDGAYTAFGKHVYRDSYGSAKTVYVSYTLRNIGGDYVIEEVGSSNSRLY